MPDLLRIRYLGPAANIPLAGRMVDSDCVFDLAGKVVEEQDDCVIVDTGAGQRALPKSRYKVETPARKRDKVEE